jgi:hypothetical protein
MTGNNLGIVKRGLIAAAIAGVCGWLTITLLQFVEQWNINGCHVEYLAPSFSPYRVRGQLVWECRSGARLNE